MDEKYKVLQYIGFAVLGNSLLLLALFLLVAWHVGWRRAVRRIWEWTLVVSVYFGVCVFALLVILPPISHWFLLHTNYSLQQIQEEEIRVERIVGKKTLSSPTATSDPPASGTPW
jgi:hypothetical protein